MEQVLKLAENYVIQRVMSNHAPLTHANKISMVLPALIGITSIVGLILCLSGLYIWLSTIMSLHSALSVMGGVFFSLSVLMVISLICFNRIKAKKTKQAREKLINDIKMGVELLDDELSNIDFIQENPKISASIATILGYTVSSQLRE